MCRLISLLYGLVRWKTFRAFLVRRHMEACPRCAAAPPSGPAPGGWVDLVHPPDWVRYELSLWPEIERRMRESAAAGPAGARPLPVTPGRRGFPGRLVPVAAGLAVVALLGVLAWRAGHKYPGGTEGATAGATAGSPRVEVLSAEVEGRKARPSVFQTKDASYIWFSRTPDEGVRR
jgi:hypothetical protein